MNVNYAKLICFKKSLIVDQFQGNYLKEDAGKVESVFVIRSAQ